jgi:hypothetical protein
MISTGLGDQRVPFHEFASTDDGRTQYFFKRPAWDALAALITAGVVWLVDLELLARLRGAR